MLFIIKVIIDIILKNPIPKWDYEYKNYKMNFNGRVKEESEKK